MRVHSIRDVAAAVRGRRQELCLSQAELAERAGVSRKWIYEFEATKPRAELGLVLGVLGELGISIVIGEEPDPARQTAPVAGTGVDLDAVLDELRPPGTSARDG